MKKVINRLKNLIKRLTFTQVVFALLVIIIILGIIQTLFTNNPDNNLTPAEKTTEEYIQEFKTKNPEFEDAPIEHVDEIEEYGRVTFPEFVTQQRPRTVDYEVYALGPNAYQVVLKNGYTQVQFESDVAAYFPDISQYSIEYVQLN